MGRRRKLKSETFGSYGYTVRLCERAGSKNYYLKWFSNGRVRWRSLGHQDWESGRLQAQSLSNTLRTAGNAISKGELTLALLFARYEREVLPHKSKARATEDKRRLNMWQAYLGPGTDPATIDYGTLDQFAAERADGKIKIRGRSLSESPGPRTIQMDIQLLNAVLNWAAVTNRRGTTKKILPYNPVEKYFKASKRAPKEKNPRQPVATYDHYMAIEEYADEADPQGLLRFFIAILEGTGWRSSAVCQLWASDADLTRSPEYPHGRLRRRGEVDKQGYGAWVPMSAAVRKAIEGLLGVRQVVGDAYLFDKARTPEKPWEHRYACKLTKRAQELAGIPKEQWMTPHAFRRKWATERKHLPRTDVAEVGGWKSVRTLDIYQHTDPETALEVVQEPRKLRAVSGLKTDQLGAGIRSSRDVGDQADGAVRQGPATGSKEWALLDSNQRPPACKADLEDPETP